MQMNWSKADSSGDYNPFYEIYFQQMSHLLKSNTVSIPKILELHKLFTEQISSGNAMVARSSDQDCVKNLANSKKATLLEEKNKTIKPISAYGSGTEFVYQHLDIPNQNKSNEGDESSQTGQSFNKSSSNAIKYDIENNSTPKPKQFSFIINTHQLSYNSNSSIYETYCLWKANLLSSNPIAIQQRSYTDSNVSDQMFSGNAMLDSPSSLVPDLQTAHISSTNSFGNTAGIKRKHESSVKAKKKSKLSNAKYDYLYVWEKLQTILKESHNDKIDSRIQVCLYIT